MGAAGDKVAGGSRRQKIGWVILRGRLPLWLKLSHTAFVAVLVACFWDQHGPQNFLWACDIALLVTAAALWRENALLASSMAVAVLLPEVAWNVDFFTRLIVGRDVFGLDATGYMFDPAIPLFVRALSLFHVFLPILPAFPPQHHVDALKAESRSHLCDLANAHSQRRLILGHACPATGGAVKTAPADTPAGR